jgi:hypothetical protein
MKVDGKIFSILQNMNSSIYAKVKLPGEISQKFTTQKGLN